MKFRSMVLVLTAVTSLAATALAQVTAADYQAWRRSEQGAVVQLMYQGWLGDLSQQDFDAARRLLPAAYWAGSQPAAILQRATDYQSWRAAERASYLDLGAADLRAWLGGFSRQEFDAARRLLPAAYWAGTQEIILRGVTDPEQ